MSSLVLYLSSFFISSLLLAGLSAFYAKEKHRTGTVLAKYTLVGMLCLTPLIALYAFRYGIGTDFFSYLRYYNVIHDVPVFEYIKRHMDGKGGNFRMEIGYFLLNKLSASLVILQFLVICIIYFNAVLAITRLNIKAWGLAIYIFIVLNYAYSMNGVRYSIALSLVLLSYSYLLTEENKKSVCCVLVAILFHKAIVFALPIVLCLGEFRSMRLNRIRDFLMIAFILLFPLLMSKIFVLFSYVPMLKPYYESGIYDLVVESRRAQSKVRWVLNIIPVVLPFIILSKKYLLREPQMRVMLRILLMEIPFRMIGLDNGFLGRFSRIPQLIHVLLIPAFMSKIHNKPIKMLVLLYYIAWYTFYFLYSVYYTGNQEVFPYQSILS